jgi:hypothetical protein
VKHSLVPTRVILADLSQLSAESLPDIPELEARIRTLQLARRSQPPYESVVAIFRLLRGVPENDSQKDARNDIIWYLCKVFDAGKLEWFAQAIRTGLQLEPETPMPTIYEALIERGVEQGIERGIERGIEKGVIIGRIRTLQEVLQQPVSSQDELVLLSHDELQLRAQQLQGLLIDRPA